MNEDDSDWIIRGTNIAINSIASRYSSNTSRTGFHRLHYVQCTWPFYRWNDHLFYSFNLYSFFNGHRAIPSHQEAREAAVMNSLPFENCAGSWLFMFHLQMTARHASRKLYRCVRFDDFLFSLMSTSLWPRASWKLMFCKNKTRFTLFYFHFAPFPAPINKNQTIPKTTTTTRI